MTFLPFDQSRPCRSEKLSGTCLTCGNKPDEDYCGYEDEHPRLKAANEIIAEMNRVIANAHAALLHAQEALFWHHAEQFEIGGVLAGAVVEQAIKQIRGAA